MEKEQYEIWIEDEIFLFCNERGFLWVKDLREMKWNDD